MCALIPTLLTILYLILINPATSSNEELKHGFVEQWHLSDLTIYLFCQVIKSLLAVSI